MKIVIVEDNLIQRELLELYLQKLEHQVVETFDKGEEFLEKYSKSHSRCGSNGYKSQRI